MCRSVALVEDEDGQASPAIHVLLSAREGSRPKCPRCQRRCPGYDQLSPRSWSFGPLWGLAVWLVCSPRRVHCPEHGVHVESLPWSDGKSPVSILMMLFLATWARRLSWGEVARVFRTSWESVERSIRWVVDWGPGHRSLDGVRSIGIDDAHWGKGEAGGNFLTVIHQIDRRSRVRGKTRGKLPRLVATNMATGRAWVLKEGFQDFWKYRSVTWARGFMMAWCGRAMRSR